MKTWMFGRATAQGMKVISDAGEKITIKANASGRLRLPDSRDFLTKIFPALGIDDTVLVAGCSYPFMDKLIEKCTVWWISELTLAQIMPELGIHKTHVHEALERIFKSTPHVFYPYLPADTGIAALRMLVKSWMWWEKSDMRNELSIQRALSDEQEYLMFHPDHREKWIARNVERELATERERRKFYHENPTPELENKMREVLSEYFATTFDGCFNPDKVRAKKAIQHYVTTHKQDWGITAARATSEENVAEFLETLPENRLFDGLLSENCVRIRALYLSFIRNPALYPNIHHLLSYAGLGLTEGQAHQRSHGHARLGKPEFKAITAFVGPQSLYRGDNVGHSKRLYYAYKAHQYYKYWGLIILTAEVFKAFGKKKVADDEGEEEDAIDAGEFKGSAEHLIYFAERIVALSHLPIIKGKPKMEAGIQKFLADPTPQNLLHLFLRGRTTSGAYKLHDEEDETADLDVQDQEFSTKKTKRGSGSDRGLNLQMTPKRIEQQCMRMIGSTILKPLFYRWRAMLGLPTTIELDYQYQSQHRLVYGVESKAHEFDCDVVVSFYEAETQRLKREQPIPLPVMVQLKLQPTPKRGATFMTFTPSEQTGVMKKLLAADQAKVMSQLDHGYRQRFLSLLSADALAKLEKYDSKAGAAEAYEEEDGEIDTEAEAAAG